MEATVAYEKLKQIFPHHMENINFMQLNPNELKNLIPKNLPQLPLSRIHSLCRSQQKNVMNKVLEIKQRDLYDEMASVCPNRDLKLMRTYSHEEVNQRIHHYSSQMAAAQDKDMQSSTDEGESDVMDVEDQMEIQENREFGGLRNIFEEYDNNFSWQDLNVYDLH